MREIDPRRLRFFNEVLAQGSIRGAAEVIDTAPSVVTRQIRQLEIELGAQLFERQARGLKPTEAAQHLLEFWRGCVAQQEQLEDRIRALQGLKKGEVQIATSEGFLDALMTEVVAPFCTDNPDLDVTVNTHTVEDVVQAVAEDRAHIGIAFNPPADAKVHYAATSSQPVAVLVHANHPLALGGQSVGLADILRYPLALMPPGFGLGQFIKTLSYAEGLDIRATLTTNSVAALRHFVANGLGVTMMSRTSAMREIERGELVALFVDHPLFASAKARLLLRTGRPLSAASNAMLERISTRMAMFANV